jgi:hypothetical protein
MFVCLAHYLNSEEYLKTKGDVRGINKIAERIAKTFMEMTLIIFNREDLTL